MFYLLGDWDYFVCVGWDIVFVLVSTQAGLHLPLNFLNFMLLLKFSFGILEKFIQFSNTISFLSCQNLKISSQYNQSFSLIFPSLNILIKTTLILFISKPNINNLYRHLMPIISDLLKIWIYCIYFYYLLVCEFFLEWL